MTVEVVAEEPFKPLYNLQKGIRFVILIGGRGGMKTTEASKFAAFSATIRKQRVAVLRDEKSRIKESILAEILKQYDRADSDKILSRQFERLESGIKNRYTDNMVIFTQGFRASRKDSTANMKSISGINIALVEEAEDLRDATKFNTFADGVRQEDSVIVMMLNTPDIQHWIVRRWFNLEPVPDEDGYWQLVPKVQADSLCIITNYLDNPYLPDAIRKSYQAYNDPNSTQYDPHYYKTAIMGWASSGRKGQVHKKIKYIKLQEYLDLPYPELYGQDFGTAAPAGTVGVKIYKNTSWCRQLNYLPMETISIAKRYISLGIKRQDKIVVDNADKEAGDKLAKGWSSEELSDEDVKNWPQLRDGFNIIKSKKGPDSVRYTISLMNGLNLYAVEESPDLWKEIQNRIYFQNKSGEYTNDPAPGFDHLLDPWGYVLVDQFGPEWGKKGKFANQYGNFR